MSSTGSGTRELPLLVILLFLAAIFTPTLAQAQSQTYTIPLEGHWLKHTIGVGIQATPAWAHDAAAEAVEIWDNAQLWFVRTYYPNSPAIFNLTIGGSDIQITFTGWQNSSEAGYTTGCCGRVYSHILIGLVTENQDNSSVPPNRVREVALHELGHGLGLGHTSTLYDLMYPGFTFASAPTTLDLDGVHTLASNPAISLPATDTLPSTIPWMLTPESAIPEFPNQAACLILFSVFALLAVRLRRTP